MPCNSEARPGRGPERPSDGVYLATDLQRDIPSPHFAQPLAFDYASLPDDVAAEARKVAARHRTNEYLFETGQDLLNIKDQLEHGQFLAWVEQELGLKPRMERQQRARAIEALKILTERFNDDELRQLVELLDDRASSVVFDVLRGKLPFCTSRAGADMLSHWVEVGRRLFSTDLGGTS